MRYHHNNTGTGYCYWLLLPPPSPLLPPITPSWISVDETRLWSLNIINRGLHSFNCIEAINLLNPHNWSTIPQTRPIRKSILLPLFPTAYAPFIFISSCDIVAILKSNYEYIPFNRLREERRRASIASTRWWVPGRSLSEQVLLCYEITDIPLHEHFGFIPLLYIRSSAHDCESLCPERRRHRRAGGHRHTHAYITPSEYLLV